MSIPAGITTRLLKAIQAVVPAVTDISIGTIGNSATVKVFPTNQQAVAQATINAFDWSAGAQTAFENTQARTLAGALVDTDKTAFLKLMRAVAAVMIDEINTLRGVVIGSTSTVWNPASMANATGLTSPNITVTGAAFGDFVDVNAPYTLAGVTATGYVVSANTVAITIHNGTGAIVDLASGNWITTVRRQGVLAPRTLAQAVTAIKAKIDAGTVD